MWKVPPKWESVTHQIHELGRPIFRSTTQILGLQGPSPGRSHGGIATQKASPWLAAIYTRSEEVHGRRLCGILSREGHETVLRQRTKQ